MADTEEEPVHILSHRGEDELGTEHLVYEEDHVTEVVDEAIIITHGKRVVLAGLGGATRRRGSAVLIFSPPVSR